MLFLRTGSLSTSGQERQAREMLDESKADESSRTLYPDLFR